MFRTGIVLALLSAVLFGASTPLAKLLLGAVSPWMMAGLLYLGAGLGLAAIHAFRAMLRLPGAEAPGLLAAAGLVGFLGYGVSLVLALRHLGTARTGAYFSLAPFVGAAIGVAFLGEPLSARLLISGALMGLGLWLHLAERHEHEHVHEELEHEHRHGHDEHHQHEHGEDAPPGEPHAHRHRHARLVHRHAHYPDLHHRHTHKHSPR